MRCFGDYKYLLSQAKYVFHLFSKAWKDTKRQFLFYSYNEKVQF